MLGEIILLLLVTLAVRAFLFEVKFQYIREKLREKHELFEIFLDCSFCNGFRTGLFGYMIAFGFYDSIIITSYMNIFTFAILSGSTSYYLTKVTKNL